MQVPAGEALRGRRVLLVEDELLVGMDSRACSSGKDVRS
jgi:hypothetical protein